MEVKQLSITDQNYFERLRNIDGPPRRLYYRGTELHELLKRPSVAIVGSRGITPYGRQVTQTLAGRLAEQGVVIISGLAYGVDSVAHRACLEAGGQTIAVLPGSVTSIYPAEHEALAAQILQQGGTLVSEYADGMPTLKQNFIARNRIVSGLADILLITEAAEKSGSLHTANFAMEQGKTVMAVPGLITVPTSVGTNNLLKTGVLVVTSYKDVLFQLNLHDHVTPARAVRGRNDNEQLILDLLLQGVSHSDQLLTRSQLSASHFNQAMTMLEISDKIRSLGGQQWAIT